MDKVIKVRIPPSPTGNLHVGTARTALFNYLFAKKEGGEIVFRFEDTDRERSKPEFEENIIEGLKWLGLSWDGEIYRQSERGDLYKKALDKLLEQGRAYYVDGAEGAIKLKVEPQEVVFEDVVRGSVKTHTDSFGGDFVIARSLDNALYHLAVVVDDTEMGITHVIRGEDHISNTARQILLQQALGYERPIYAHLPLLVDDKRRKLSKRAGDTDLLSYRAKGYLAEAMVNYLALLGWNPKTDREFFSLEELAQAFSLEGIQKGSAAFSLEKLKAVNKHYLKDLSEEELLEKSRGFLEKEGIGAAEDEGYWQAALKTEQERAATLEELAKSVEFFKLDWGLEVSADVLVWRKSTKEETVDKLEKTRDFLNNLSDEDFREEDLEKKVLDWIDKEVLGRGDSLWPMRVALTGQEHSPGPFEVGAVLGKEKTINRLDQAIAIMKA